MFRVLHVSAGSKPHPPHMGHGPLLWTGCPHSKGVTKVPNTPLLVPMPGLGYATCLPMVAGSQRMNLSPGHGGGPWFPDMGIETLLRAAQPAVHTLGLRA